MSSSATRSAPTAAASVQSCPITPVVDLVFSRWTTPILWKLNEHGRLRFVELHRHIGTITPKVLTQRLRQLERDGLVERTYHPKVPPRVEYEITELGRSLAPVFHTLATWSAANLDKVETARIAYDTDERQLTLSPRDPSMQGRLESRLSGVDAERAELAVVDP